MYLSIFRIPPLTRRLFDSSGVFSVTDSVVSRVFEYLLRTVVVIKARDFRWWAEACMPLYILLAEDHVRQGHLATTSNSLRYLLLHQYDTIHHTSTIQQHHGRVGDQTEEKEVKINTTTTTTNVPSTAAPSSTEDEEEETTVAGNLLFVSLVSCLGGICFRRIASDFLSCTSSSCKY